MLTEDNLDIPEIDVLLDSLENLLTGFDPRSLTYLDQQGVWKKNPATIRDRISNELWFHIWEASSYGESSCGARPFDCRREQIADLFSPLLQDRKHWTLARMLFRKERRFHEQGRSGEQKHSREAGGISHVRSAGNSHGAGPGVADVFTACELLGFSIEYGAYIRNSDAYVADWDSRGKETRARYLEKSQRLLDELRQRLPAEEVHPKSCDDLSLETFTKLNELLRAEEKSVFCRIVLIISEEERLRSSLQLLSADLKDTRQRDEVRDFMSEQLNVTKGIAAEVPGILLRSCIEILTNSEIDVSTGMQFEASGVLGKLKDPRSTDALMTALDFYDQRYTDLRANILYALGNLKRKEALSNLVRVLEGPYSVKVRIAGGAEYSQPLRAEKCEAVWALGKLGSDAIEAMPALVRQTGTVDKETKLYLAWAIGMIGDGQKEKYGGIDAGVLTALVNLLTAKQSGLFEEAAFALKKLGLPDFLHTLYLHDLATVPILSLKPSSTGLYELSETLLHLASIKKPVVMAVTGDSGTGKTYFCQTIANGFSGIKASEILYLMRDRIGDRTLDRILGIGWLRKHNTAQFCEGYPLTEKEDNPEEFFDEFMRQNADKKLIVLDGWRDHAYFHQVVRTFYEKGYLDVLVKFQTTFSTRRINLEEREGVLERVKLHLPLVEDPAIEETPFYREGAVLIYNLDNSIPSRLNREETLQVFERRKVDTWADQIRIGEFTRDVKPLRIDDEVLPYHVEDIASETQEILAGESIPFSPGEATFSRILNESIDLHPNLLQLIKLETVAANRTAFYTHGQIACCGYDGTVAVLTGLNDRILYANVHDSEVIDLAVVAGDIYSVDRFGSLKVTSFYRNTIANIAKSDSPIFSLASHRDARIATGHADGTVRVWNLGARTMTTFKAHAGPVLSLAIDHRCRIYSGGEDMLLRAWDLEAGRVRVFRGHKAPINAISLYPDGRIVTGTQSNDRFERREAGRGAKIRMVDVESGACRISNVCDEGTVATINVYFDGRLFVGVRRPAGAGVENTRGGTVIVLDPRPGFQCFNVLDGHLLETRDCVTMGPRLITCGSEGKNEHTLRIWGTVSYVEIEREKSRLMPETAGKPPYYRSLF